jgi:hypothetical protein
MTKFAVAGPIVLAVLVSACTSDADQDVAIGQVDKATKVQLEAAARNASMAEETYMVENGRYTTDVDVLKQMGLSYDRAIRVSVPRANGASYCIEARSGAAIVHQQKGTAPADGAC